MTRYRGYGEVMVSNVITTVRWKFYVRGLFLFRDNIEKITDTTTIRITYKNDAYNKC